MTNSSVTRWSPLRCVAWPGVTTLIACGFWCGVDRLDEHAEQRRHREELRRQSQEPLFRTSNGEAATPDHVAAQLRESVARRAAFHEVAD